MSTSARRRLALATSVVSIGLLGAGAAAASAADDVPNGLNGSVTAYDFQAAPDTTPPVVTIAGAPPAYVSSTSAHVAFTASDPAPTSGILAVDCRLDAGAYAPCESTTDHDLAGLGQGAHTLTVRATDGEGNVGTASATWTVDTIPPTTTITAGPADPTASTVGDVAFSGADGGSGVDHFACRRDGGAWATCTSVDAATVAEGQRSFDVRAVDRAGNVDATPAHRAWLVDLTGPTVSISSPAARTQDAYGPGDTRQLVRPFSPLHGGPPVYSCRDPLAGSPAGASGIASCTDDFDSETLGSHELNVRAVDRVGHVTNSRDSTPRAYSIVPPKYDTFVMGDHPTAYFRQDDPLGATTMVDRSGNGHDGTYQHGVVLRQRPALTCEDWADPVHHPDAWCDPFNLRNQGYSAFYDGTAADAYANGISASGDDDHGQANQSFSVDGWAYPVGTATMGMMEHGEEFRVSYDGRWHVRAVSGVELVSASTYAPDRWYHVAVTWDGTTIRLYVNGDQVATGTATHSWAGGQPTFFVGRTNIPSAGWHGRIDEVAYYDGTVLSAHAIRDRWKIGASREPGGAGPGVLDMTRPTVDIREPVADATYTSATMGTLPVPPRAAWSCDDPDGASTVTSCTATVDGAPIAQGALLPLTAGTHAFVVVAVNANGLRFEQHDTYVAEPFAQIVLGDGPELYYRFGEAAGDHVVHDATGRHDGEYKNDTATGPTGISGDGNTTRAFLGKGGYASVNGVPASPSSWSVESWVRPDDTGDMAIFDHGAGGSAPALFLRGQRLVLHLPDPDGELVAPAPFPYDGRFHQVAATWDGATAKLFVDGRVVATRESTKAPSGMSTLYVGFGNVGLWHPWFRGAIDETSYYRTALSDQRIYEHWLADPGEDDDGTGMTPTPAASTPSSPAGPSTAAPVPAGASAPAGSQRATSAAPQATAKQRAAAAKKKAAKKKAAAAKRTAAKRKAAAAKRTAAKRKAAAAKRTAAKRKAAAAKRTAAKRKAAAAKRTAAKPRAAASKHEAAVTREPAAAPPSRHATRHRATRHRATLRAG